MRYIDVAGRDHAETFLTRSETQIDILVIAAPVGQRQ